MRAEPTKVGRIVTPETGAPGAAFSGWPVPVGGERWERGEDGSPRRVSPDAYFVGYASPSPRGRALRSVLKEIDARMDAAGSDEGKLLDCFADFVRAAFSPHYGEATVSALLEIVRTADLPSIRAAVEGNPPEVELDDESGK